MESQVGVVKEGLLSLAGSRREFLSRGLSQAPLSISTKACVLSTWIHQIPWCPIHAHHIRPQYHRFLSSRPFQAHLEGLQLLSMDTYSTRGCSRNQAYSTTGIWHLAFLKNTSVGRGFSKSNPKCNGMDSFSLTAVAQHRKSKKRPMTSN